jgi:predicted transcriptional regulator
MASELIQFRLSGKALEALQGKQKEGESLNLAAQRVMKEMLGVVDTAVDIDERIDAKLQQFKAELLAELGKQPGKLRKTAA